MALNASCKDEASPTFLGDEAAARQVYGVRAQHTEGEVPQGLEDKAARMVCAGSMHRQGGRSRGEAHMG